MTPRRGRLLALAIGVALALALLAAAEIVTRLLVPGSPLKPAASFSKETAEFERLHSEGIELDPYRVYRLAPNQHYDSISINRLGLRGPEPAVPKPPGVLRVLCLGGSVVFGYGTSSDATAPPAVLERLLESGAPTPWRVEVVNAGIGGYVSRQELVLLRELASQLDPDVVVVIDGGNDLLSPFSNAGRIGLPWGYLRFEQAFADFKRHEARPVTLLSDFARSAATGLAARSRLFGLLAGRIAPPAPRVPLDLEGIAPLYGSNVEAMALFARRARAGLLVVLQPVWGIGETGPDRRLALWEAANPGYIVSSQRAIAEMRHTLARLGADPELELHWLDASTLFAGRRDVFRDALHYATDAQNAELAAAIAPDVARLLVEAAARRRASPR